MTRNKLNDAFDLFATVKTESNELFRETAVILEAYDKKLESCSDAWLYSGLSELPKANSRGAVIRRIITLRDDLNRLAKMLKEG